MQAVTGFERAIGGAGNDPIAATWIPLDMTGGWVAAIGMLAGLYARAVSGHGQLVESSLLGAGILLHSGVFKRDGLLTEGPALDAAQTGYGPGYRLYECGDGEWLALVVPDPGAWRKLAGLVPAGERYIPLRGGDSGSGSATDAAARELESALETAFKARAAADWVRRLRAEGLLVELVKPLDRDAFRTKILDDPVNRQLGRVVEYATADWGNFQQIGPLVRCGPQPVVSTRLMLPGVGEHTTEVLAELGLDGSEIQTLLNDKVARQSEGPAHAV
jgi:crotonobetainyl-CoA:carnitine CoA-transferase CaiB-like acyl-CoA transferase